MQIYATLDANLQPVALSGPMALLYWQQQAVGEYARSDHHVVLADVAGWDAAALTLNRVQVVDIPEPPAGQTLEGYTLERGSDGVITAKANFQPEAPGPRAELPKSTVTDRLDALGKLGAVFTGLQANPRAFARWFSPDWPNVYKDDAELLTLLSAVGLTADEIAQVTA